MVGSFLLDAYFLTIIAGIENTERVAYDFSNEQLWVGRGSYEGGQEQYMEGRGL